MDAPGAAPPPVDGRYIIDASVINFIARGDQQVATELRRLVADPNNWVRLSQRGLAELTGDGTGGLGPANADTRALQQAIIDHYGLKTAPDTPYATVYDVQNQNVNLKFKRAFKPIAPVKDASVVAEALHNNAAIWTVDQAFAAEAPMIKDAYRVTVSNHGIARPAGPMPPVSLEAARSVGAFPPDRDIVSGRVVSVAKPKAGVAAAEEGEAVASAEEILGAARAQLAKAAVPATETPLGVARVGGIAFVLVAVGTAVYAISQADDKVEATEETLLNLGLQTLFFGAAGGGIPGVVASAITGLDSDSKWRSDQIARQREEDRIVTAFLRARVPGAVVEHRHLLVITTTTIDPTLYNEARNLLFNTKPLTLTPAAGFTPPTGPPHRPSLQPTFGPYRSSIDRPDGGERVDVENRRDDRASDSVRSLLAAERTQLAGHQANVQRAHDDALRAIEQAQSAARLAQFNALQATQQAQIVQHQASLMRAPQLAGVDAARADAELSARSAIAQVADQVRQMQQTELVQANEQARRVQEAAERAQAAQRAAEEARGPAFPAQIPWPHGMAAPIYSPNWDELSAQAVQRAQEFATRAEQAQEASQRAQEASIEAQRAGSGFSSLPMHA